jgi:type I restriction enzyme S subunit
MKLETFFERFDLFADAPEAVAKMRDLVLDLAVQGKVANQDANDEPAADLLQRLIKFKAANPLTGRSGRSKEVPVKIEVNTDGLPRNWVNTTIGEVLYVIRGASPRPKGDPQYFSETRTAYHWVKISDIRKHGQNGRLTDTDEFLTEAGMRKSVLLPKGTLVLTNSATIGVPIVLGIEGCCIHDGYLAFPNFPHELLNQKFIVYLFHTLKKYAERNARGLAQLNLNTDLVRSFPFGLPPIAEQKRIVAKVDELMALCDRLALQQEERETRRAALASASLDRFADAPTPANLPFLFHPAYAIAPADLRKSILTLAVEGKLVPQDPNDEPAEDLLVRCNVERQMIGRATPTTVQAIESVETLGYEIPPSWEWRSLGDLLILGPTNGFSPKAVDYETLVRSLTLSATTSGRFKGEHSKFISTDVPVDSDLWLRDGDILVQRGNTIEYVGVAAVYRGKPNAFIYPDLMMKLRVSSLLDVGFVHLAMSQDAARDFLRARASGTSGSMPKINQGTLKSLPIPIPPLPEQRRIVAKVNELMALVDQLEEQLSAATKQGGALLESAVHELLSPSAEIIQLSRTHSASLPDRAAIGCYAIQQLAERPTFGRTALVKVLYLAEAHIGLELGGQYLREAAGPLDQWIYTFEEQAGEQQWFSVDERSTKDGHKKIDYRKGPNLSAKAAEAGTQLPPALRKELDRLLALLANKSTVDVEIIATLFAAWNDSLIDGHAPSDAEITRDVRQNWHPSKQRFKERELKKWLGWMRQHSLVPKGRGPHTRSFQVTLRLHS